MTLFPQAWNAGGSSGWNWMPAPFRPRGEALLILVNIHTSARNAWVSIGRHLCFRMSWISSVPGTFTIILVWSKHKLCREKKPVYLKSAKEQHFFMPQQLLNFSISFFPYYLRKKFLTSYLSFWLMLRTVLTFAQICRKLKFSSLVVFSMLWFTYNKSYFLPYNVICHSFSFWSVCVTRTSWNPQ